MPEVQYRGQIALEHELIEQRRRGKCGLDGVGDIQPLFAAEGLQQEPAFVHGSPGHAQFEILQIG
ncbi:MAG: hypothetical protein AB2615_19035 [Candidatus Thiodiazotropha sp.]